MRVLLAVLALTVCGLAAPPGPAWPARADPADFCPPSCDRIPGSAWIDPASIPLHQVYEWPQPAGLAVTDAPPRFRIEEDCATPPVAGDDREYAVAARVVVPRPDGQWQLQLQVVHWRGETWRGAQTVLAAMRTAAAALRSCPLTAPGASPSVTTDEPERLAAVVTIGAQRVLHSYLLAQPRNSTVVELAMWSTTPTGVEWPPVPDAQVFDAMAAPLCTAYIDSCR